MFLGSIGVGAGLLTVPVLIYTGLTVKEGVIISLIIPIMKSSNSFFLISKAFLKFSLNKIFVCFLKTFFCILMLKFNFSNKMILFQKWIRSAWEWYHATRDLNASLLVSKSEINANPKDSANHPRGVWTLPPVLRLKEKDKDKYLAIGESDRMTLLFRKPKS